jgi:hypothetical protein
MAINFTKPIRFKGGEGTITVLFHDEKSIFYEWNYNQSRVHLDLDDFQERFENVPEEPKKFKAYIGLKRLQGMDRVESYLNKKILEENGYEQIQEVEFISGEGLQ